MLNLHLLPAACCLPPPTSESALHPKAIHTTNAPSLRHEAHDIQQHQKTQRPPKSSIHLHISTFRIRKRRKHPLPFQETKWRPKGEWEREGIVQVEKARTKKGESKETKQKSTWKMTPCRNMKGKMKTYFDSLWSTKLQQTTHGRVDQR